MQMSELQAKSNNNLALCPFCGGEAFVNDDPTGNGGKPHMSGNVGLGRLWSVECDDCGADAGFWQDRNVAIAAWNSRAERTCRIEHVKCGAMYDVWRCSTCGYEYAESVSEKGIVQNYCPNCGARVVGE